MASGTQQFRQSFLLTGAVVALVLVTGFALVSSRSVTRIVERQADERGRDVATHAASLVGMYLRERRRLPPRLHTAVRVRRALFHRKPRVLRPRLEPDIRLPAVGRGMVAAGSGGRCVRRRAALRLIGRRGVTRVRLGHPGATPGRPDTETLSGAAGEELVVTVPVDNGKWWVVFRQPKAAAYAAARTTAANIVLWTVVLRSE